MKHSLWINVNIILVIAIAGFTFIPATSNAAEKIIVADFNRGERLTNLGTQLGAWDKNPEDKTQTCIISFAPGQKSMALKIEYDVDSPYPAYNGVWIKLNNLNASKYKNITFEVKGDLSGCTSIFKIELKNQKESDHTLVTEVTNEWTTKTIPLKDFVNLTDFSELTELVIVFDDMVSTKKVGTLYIDNVAFE